MSQSINSNLQFDRSEPPPIGLSVKGKVARVIDGDTVVVEVTKRVHVRLLECWAPELKTGEAGLQSKQFMEQLLHDKEVYLVIPGDEEEFGHFTFGRVLGRIYVKQEDKFLDVSQEAVANGFATRVK